MAYFPPYIDASGIHLPTYADRLEDLCSAYRTIFGQEAELSPAVPDYQLLSVFAKALDDVSALALMAYNSRNPAYASGQALDLLLPAYGISRLPGETDAEARVRMKHALAARGVSSAEAMEAAIREIPGADHVKIRVNDGDAAVDGIPGHTIAALSDGGSAQRIAEAIWRKKPPGIGTAGSIAREVEDGQGNTCTVRFSRPMMIPVHFRIELRTYAGFDEAAVGEAMREALLAHVNEKLEIGESMTLPALYGMLYQAAGAFAPTFALTDLLASGTFGAEREKLAPAWNEKYVLNSGSDVEIVISGGNP